MKGWTHSSSWRLWFTFNAADNSHAPSEIWLDPKLQNVREQKMSGSTNHFTLCKVYVFGRNTSLLRHTIRHCIMAYYCTPYVGMTPCSSFYFRLDYSWSHVEIQSVFDGWNLNCLPWLFTTKMLIVHIQCLLIVNGSIWAGVFITYFFVLCLNLHIPPTQQVAAYW